MTGDKGGAYAALAAPEGAGSRRLAASAGQATVALPARLDLARRAFARVRQLALPLKRARSRLRGRTPRHDFRTVRNGGIVFGAPIQQQGLSFEIYLARVADLGDWLYEQKKNFKVFDFYDRRSRVATSVKTMNLSRLALRDHPERIFRYLRRDIERIRAFDFDKIADEIISSEHIRGRRLELAVPADFNAQQLAQLERARAYAESCDIEMKVSVAT